MDAADIASRIVERRRLVIVALTLVTAGLFAGVPMVEEETQLDEYRTESDETEALETIEERFDARGSETTPVQVVVRGENVLDREALLSILEFQRTVVADEEIDRTLVEDEPVLSVPNAVATAAVRQDRAADLEQRQAELNATATELESALGHLESDNDASVESEFETVREDAPIDLTSEDRARFLDAAAALRDAETAAEREDAYERGTHGVLADEYEELASERESLEETDPSLEAQIDQLESMDDYAVEETVESVLDEEDGPQELFALMSDDYEPGETTASGTILVFQQDVEGEFVAVDSAPPAIVETQREIEAIADADDSPLSYTVFGYGITADEIDAATADSMTVVGPLALAFVVAVLLIAYRDPIDVALGFVGIGLVLGWTIGLMGWLGIDFNVLFVAVPVLLIGLSIDYAIHVFMRQREARWGTDRSAPRAMSIALAGVGVALVYVTVTTAAGFLSNLTSTLDPIREFGLVSAFGIAAALVIFGLFVPMVKVELDGWLERRGFDRSRSAFGSGDRLRPVLQVGALLARRAPVVVLLVLVVSAGGVYGGTGIETEFSSDEFMPKTPAWTDELPSSLAPREYTAAAAIDTLDEDFVRQERQAQLLVEGDVTRSKTLRAVDNAERRAADSSVSATLATDDPAVRGPLSTMEDVAAANESFNETFHASDTIGDGVPDTDLESVYDALYDADEDAAAAVISRTEDGEYDALRIVIAADGDASDADVTAEMETIADSLEDEANRADDGAVTVTPTGQETVIAHQTETGIFETIVDSLLLTLATVGAFLAIVYRSRAGRATLGLVTLVPVLVALSWILGTMALLDISFNFLTGMITSLTIGLGVAYSIHVSERYNQELAQGRTVQDALRTTLVGTGGALLGSAATTAGGFGVLTVAFLPSLQQFGLLIALSIVYAFIASVFIHPSLLALWTRLVGPELTTDRHDAVSSPRTTSNED